MSIFEHNAKALRELKEQIELAYTRRDLDNEHRSLWEEACNRFHASFDQLAFPGGLDRQLRLLRERDQEAIEMAVRFLEADPWFFRSGYIKEDLLHLLGRVELSDNQQARLRAVILDRIDGGARREFRRYGRLARKLDEPKFRETVRQRLESEDSGIVRRARWVLKSLES